MRRAMIGVLMGAGIGWLAANWGVGFGEVYAVPAQQPTSGQADLVTLVTDAGDEGQAVLLVDPRTHAMVTYHIDRESGEIVLKSVRNFHWDLQLLEYNGTSPHPEDVRGMLEGQ